MATTTTAPAVPAAPITVSAPVHGQPRVSQAVDLDSNPAFRIFLGRLLKSKDLGVRQSSAETLGARWDRKVDFGRVVDYFSDTLKWGFKGKGYDIPQEFIDANPGA